MSPSNAVYKQIRVNDQIINALVVDENSLNQYIEKDDELLELSKQDIEKMKSENKNKKDEVKKIRAKDIQIKSGVIPSKDDIYQLCNHGYYNKIMLIEKSYFTKSVREEYISFMKKRIDAIKEWMLEESASEEKKIYLGRRKGNIFKIIRYFRDMDEMEKKQIENKIFNNI
jgi:hypothetical protein